MTTFASREQAVAVFERLFEILLEDETFSTRMRAGQLSLRLVQTKPDFSLYVDPDGVSIDGGPERAAVTIKMSCDTAHQLWMGTLLMPLAVATGKVRIKGGIPKVLEFVPLLQPAFDRYPAIATELGVAA